ncbi:MAG TPA: hypothetical protein VFX58_18565 [Chitinophagaceae bacterium]|nr:hypothetical protein [Chitinophagaceae bacterium]
MANTKKQLRICRKGHRYYKSSSCPVCPVCEKEKAVTGFLALLSAPARRALEQAGIKTLRKLSTYTETQVLAFHGIGPTTIPKLRAALAAAGLSFRK